MSPFPPQGPSQPSQPSQSLMPQGQVGLQGQQSRLSDKIIGDRIKSFVQSRVGDPGNIERIQQLANLRKQHYYWEGHQYLRPMYMGSYTVDWKP